MILIRSKRLVNEIEQYQVFDLQIGATFNFNSLKAADLRKDGSAEPVVDEIATVELDLWARERGLLKIQPNVLGL